MQVDAKKGHLDKQEQCEKGQQRAFAEALEQRAPQAFDAGPDASQRRDRCELSLVQSG